MKKTLLLLTLALMVSVGGFAQTKAHRAKLQHKMEQMVKYNAQRSFKTVPTAAEKAKRAKNRADGTCTVTLSAGDVWGDGSGYQMLLDADATMLASTDGEASQALFDLCEYKIPENADFDVNTQNIIINNSVTITIPAGTYDWIIFNPTPGQKYYKPYKGNTESFAQGFVFEAGNSYEFTVVKNGSKDAVYYTINGEEPFVTAYKRPAGTFFTADYPEDASYAYYYLYAPNSVPITFENKSTDPAVTTWTYGDEPIAEGTSGDAYVEDNNAVMTYSPIIGGYIEDLPVLHHDTVTYTCADGDYHTSNGTYLDLDHAGVYVTREMNLLGIFDGVRGDSYYGYAPPSGTMPAKFGFGGIYPVSDNGSTYVPYAIYQEFEKPAAPLYLEEVMLPCYTDKIDGKYTGIPEGKRLAMNIVALNEDGSAGETLGTFYCTSKDITIYGNFEPDAKIAYGSVEFLNLTEDEFGNEKIEGVVIDKPFAIIITGLNQEGVDVGFRLNVISAVDAEAPYQAPTIQYYVNKNNGEDILPDYDEGYITMFYLYGIMDNVSVVKEMEGEDGEVVSGYDWLRVDETDADKIAYTDIEDEEEQLSFAYLIATQAWTTTIPAEEEGGEDENYDNYELIFNDGTGEAYEAPEWLDYVIQDETREGYYAKTFIQFYATNSDLTQGNVIEVDGRRGRFCAVSVETLCGPSENFYIIQGDLTHEDVLNALGILEPGGSLGIQNVTAQKGFTPSLKEVYNLAGQRVNKDYRGIVIEKGKKFIKK